MNDYAGERETEWERKRETWSKTKKKIESSKIHNDMRNKAK